MKPSFFLSLLVLLSGTCLPLPFLFAQTTDPARVEALHQHYSEGVHLSEQGKFDEALPIFLDILKEEPQAKGSLYFAGYISLAQNHPEQALDYLNRLHDLAPNDPKPLTLLIQANQALRRDIRVEAFRKQLYILHNSTPPTPGLSDLKTFPRERVFDEKEGTHIEFTEFFDYKADPFIVWEALQLDAQGKPLRHLILTYNEEQTTALHQKDPEHPEAESLLFGEFVIKEEAIRQFNLYRQETAMPTYATFRSWVMDALKNPPKPLYVQPTS